MEASADLVVHAAGRHLRQGRLDPRAGVGVFRAEPAPEEELQPHRGRELRRASEPAVDGIELPADRRGRGLQDGGGELPGGIRARPGRSGLEMPEHLGGGGLELLAARLPGPGDRREDLGKARPSPPRSRRKVGPAVERTTLGREEERQRPSAAARHHLDGLHVDVVDVGPFLAVDLDGDEIAVQGIGDALRLEGLVLHDVAPVTGRVSDRQEDGFFFGARLLEGFRAPGIPVDGVVLVLEEVRRGLAGEAVGHSGRISLGEAEGPTASRTPARPCGAPP